MQISGVCISFVASASRWMVAYVILTSVSPLAAAAQSGQLLLLCLQLINLHQTAYLEAV